MIADRLTAALDLHAAGYSVIPIRPDGSKAPATPWKTYTQHRATTDQIHAWFTADANDVAVVQGATSGNAELIELEGRAVHHLQELRDLAHDTGLGDLWDTITRGWVETSPSGGIHLHLRSTHPIAGNTKLARDHTNTVLAETRGEGGYVIVAPSRHHPTGNQWNRLVGGPDTTPTFSPDQIEALHALFSTLDTSPQRDATPTPTPAPPADGRTRPGDDFEQRTDWADILTPHGWTLATTRGATRYWTRPGKTFGISATTGHATDRDRLYVFSSSTPFTPETSHTKLYAYATLNHGGNMSAAAKELARLGYGDQPSLTPREDLHAIQAPPTPNQLIATAAQSAPGAPVAAPAAQEGAGAPPPPQAVDVPPSWRPIDLTPYLDGTWRPPTPTMLARTDGGHLIYPGLVHDLHGESESGKSLVAQHLTVEQLRAGHPALYVDFESDAGQIAHRLLAMGATHTDLLTNLTYIRPEASPYALTEAPEWAALLTNTFTLAIFDGVTDALGQFGAATKENDDIAAWHRMVPRALAVRTGASVVLVDHVAKNTDTRGRFAIGGQAKMASIDGASYNVEVTEPLGKGLKGLVTIRVGKDRPGEIRPICGPYRASDRSQEAAKIEFDSTSRSRIDVTVSAPEGSVTDRDEGGGSFKPTGIMEKLSRLLEAIGEPMSKRSILRSYKDDGGKARDQTVYDALNRLVEGGWVVESDPYRGHPTLAHERPYRQVDDPDSDAYEAPIEVIMPPQPECFPVLPTASRVLPGSSGRECFPASPPVGGSGSTHSGDGRETASASRSKHGYVFDYLIGEWVNPTTGELWDGD